MPVDFDDLMKGLYPAVSRDDEQDAGNMIMDWSNTQGFLQDKYLLSDPQVNYDHQLVEGTSKGQHLLPGSLETNASCEFDNRNFDISWVLSTDNQPFTEYGIESLKTNHEMPYGKECQDSAVYLEASVSGFKRNCTEVGSNPWPDSNRVLGTVSTIEGNNIPNSITDHTHMGAQPSLDTILTLPLNFENVKRLFNKLIVLPLEDLADPEKESCMKKALSILKDNYYHLFSAVEGEQMLEVLTDFSLLVVNWRRFCSQSQMYSQQSSAEMENIKNLTVTASKDEENLKVRFEGLKNKEKELMKQLEAVQKEKEEIAEQMNEKSKTLISLKEKNEACIFKEENATRVATDLLKKLSTQWAMYSTISL
ncbi:uncharacterized protein [Solanum tuberosum]|uniref:uncharacterized protein isoform X2 n=1 Tax=Solanum tuberosum TaxID=4113 RepID=UPI0003D27296|nr:PREDICTED: uncharacterized protein LOC102604008 isoform X2 [Solanum tuberosum]